MIPGYGAVTQALLGTLLTWGLTAVGAGCVFFIRGKHVCIGISIVLISVYPKHEFIVGLYCRGSYLMYHLGLLRGL